MMQALKDKRLPRPLGEIIFSLVVFSLVWFFGLISQVSLPKNQAKGQPTLGRPSDTGDKRFH
jgi:hypothetical protein